MRQLREVRNRRRLPREDAMTRSTEVMEPVEKPGRLLLAIKEWQRQLSDKRK
jgi:hypothetical protein